MMLVKVQVHELMLYKKLDGLCVRTFDNPLANIHGLSSPIDVQSIQ